MKSVFVLATCLGALTISHASFEMLLVADDGNGTGGTAKVHRVDGATGAYLGSFGGGLLQSARGISIDQSTGRAYVTETGGGIHVFDYNTGLYFGRVGSSSFFDRYTVFKNKAVYGSGSGLDKTDVATGERSSVVMPNGGDALWVADYSATEIIVNSHASGTSASLYRYNVVTGVFTPISNAFDDSPASNFANAVYLPNLGSITTPVIVAGLGALGDLRMYRLTAQNTYLTVQNWNSDALLNCYGVVSAHAGFFACGASSADSTKGVITYFDNYGEERQTYSNSNFHDLRGMAAVVAPEPGSMVALTAGMIALIARRRRSN
jgi:hypothetical protein